MKKTIFKLFKLCKLCHYKYTIKNKKKVYIRCLLQKCHFIQQKKVKNMTQIEYLIQRSKWDKSIIVSKKKVNTDSRQKKIKKLY